MEFNLQRVRDNVRNATTEDLLDRVTVYRSSLEPAALPVILEELRTRGVTPEAVVAHESSLQSVIYDVDGSARSCQRCRKPATARQWDWHWMFGKIPVFPRLYYLCDAHRKRRESDDRPTTEPAASGQ